MNVIRDGAQLYAVIHSELHPTERDRVWDMHPFDTVCKYLRTANVQLMSDDKNQLFILRSDNKLSPAYLQGLIDICRGQISIKAKKNKPNSFEANCLEDDASDIELLAETYLPLENEARERVRVKQEEKPAVVDMMDAYSAEPDIPVWMLF